MYFYEDSILSSAAQMTFYDMMVKNNLMSSLYNLSWFRGEMCMVIGHKSSGKTRHALMAFYDIAANERVVFYSCRNSVRSIDYIYTPNRYSADWPGWENGLIYPAGEHTFEKAISEKDLVDQLIDCAEDAKVIILDDLDSICADGYNRHLLLRHLRQAADANGLSVMVVVETPGVDGHGPKYRTASAYHVEMWRWFDRVTECRNGTTITYDVPSVAVKHPRATTSRRKKTKRLGDVASMAMKVKTLTHQGLSQRAIAARLGISQTTVSKLFNTPTPNL